MTVIERVVTLTTSYLPTDQARQLLLPPVRLVRAGAVTVATTVRHWELVLEGETGPVVAEGSTPVRRPSASPQPPEPPATRRTTATTNESAAQAVDEETPPVEDWAELSYADAQARLTTCTPDDLRTLLAYERAHGHRPQYTLLLEQRLAESA